MILPCFQDYFQDYLSDERDRLLFFSSVNHFKFHELFISDDILAFKDFFEDFLEMNGNDDDYFSEDFLDMNRNDELCSFRLAVAYLQCSQLNGFFASGIARMCLTSRCKSKKVFSRVEIELLN